MPSRDQPTPGAASTLLLKGEKVAVELISCVGRSGRAVLRVGVFGNPSFPWADVVHKRGARLEAVVADKPELTTFSKSHCGIKPSSLSLSQATSLPSSGPCDGFVFGTIKLDSNKDVEMFTTLMRHWKPVQALVMLDGGFSRPKVLKNLPALDSLYSHKLSKARHVNFGGVPSSQWHVIHYSWVGKCLTASQLMTVEHDFQVLQSYLDNTETKSSKRIQFRTEFGKEYYEMIKLNRTYQEL